MIASIDPESSDICDLRSSLIVPCSSAAWLARTWAWAPARSSSRQGRPAVASWPSFAQGRLIPGQLHARLAERFGADEALGGEGPLTLEFPGGQFSPRFRVLQQGFDDRDLRRSFGLGLNQLVFGLTDVGGFGGQFLVELRRTGLDFITSLQRERCELSAVLAATRIDSPST